MAVRMYITTVFDRNVSKSGDYISVGGYEITFRDHGTMKFDFCESAGYIDGNAVSWSLRYIDTDGFPESENLQELLINDEIVDFPECYVYVESKNDRTLQLERIIDLSFEVFTGESYIDIKVPDEMLESIEFD